LPKNLDKSESPTTFSQPKEIILEAKVGVNPNQYQGLILNEIDIQLPSKSLMFGPTISARLPECQGVSDKSWLIENFPLYVSGRILAYDSSIPGKVYIDIGDNKEKKFTVVAYTYQLAHLMDAARSNGGAETVMPGLVNCHYIASFNTRIMRDGKDYFIISNQELTSEVELNKFTQVKATLSQNKSSFVIDPSAAPYAIILEFSK
jgi:hypothetical protein